MFTGTTEQTSHSGSRESLRHLIPTSKTSSSRKRRRSLRKRALFAGIVLVAFFSLQMPDAVGGTGTFQNGKFNFCVSVRFNATPTQIQRFKDVLQAANSILYDATDGQHSLGTISIINDSGASDQAELWILPGSARGNATDFGYGIRGKHITLHNLRYFENTSITDGALTFVHEFGHHVYNLGDEYQKPGSTDRPARCPGEERVSPTLNYCMMDFVIVKNSAVKEFCVDSNHDKPLANGLEGNWAETLVTKLPKISKTQSLTLKPKFISKVSFL